MQIDQLTCWVRREIKSNEKVKDSEDKRVFAANETN